jgi:hypothetical protein
VLAHFPAAARFPDTVSGRKRMYAALDRVHLDGRAEKVEYKDGHRNTRAAWRIVAPTCLGEPEAGSLLPPNPQNNERTRLHIDACIRQLRNDTGSNRTDELTRPLEVNAELDGSEEKTLDRT